MSLNKEQIKRYSRHILLNNVGGKGQEKLLNSKVLVIGAGGLGSPISLYLAAAGILGTIQATEALKYILGLDGLLTNQFLTFDALAPEFRIVPVKPTEWAAVAKDNKKITELIEYEQPVCDFHPDAQYTEV
jgi:molybdopterin/thiamine biosynthesis adenylyltransferase